ncbi:MAG: chemotaxis protein CheW, partial [Gammaproteobacteria bacterium]|nr:chemotaxis protein CheW [Gammaproteobacteria bacterium]
EIEQALEALGEKPGVNACAAISRGMELLRRALGRIAVLPRKRELTAVAELRSVRGAPPPWCNPLVDYTGEIPEGGQPVDPTPAEGRLKAITVALAVYRKSLLALLKSDSCNQCEQFAFLCARVARACEDENEGRRWRAAGAVFAAADEAGEGDSPLVKRLAVKLEQVLRGLSEDAPPNLESRRAMIEDLQPLAALIKPPRGAEAGAPDDDRELPISVNVEGLQSAFQQLLVTPDPHALLAQIADAFLVDGDYARCVEASELAARPGSADALRAVVSRWTSPPQEAGEPAAKAVVSARFAEAQAALDRINGALNQTAGPDAENPAPPSGVPVDEALLENLNLVAREIRGARSRAEANLGTLRGGLQDMGRTIRTLRTQLEALEVDSQVPTPAQPAADSETGVPASFGALARGIEELAGLKDALQALTEETETVLAAQAGEDTQLEQGLLKTRMTPVGARFDALTQSVQRAAAGRGVAATLAARGAEVALERSQVEALARVLEALLEACVREGLTSIASPVRSDPAEGLIELEVFQLRFDVGVNIAYRGALLSGSALSALTPLLDAAGAVCSNSVGGEGRVSLSLRIPGPPRPMDLLMLEVGQNRFALPVKNVSGVSRPPRAALAPGGDDGIMSFEGERYRLTHLAQALGLKAAGGNGGACVLVAGDNGRLACVVDAVMGRESHLVNSPGQLLASNPWVLGVVLDERAAPTLVLDLSALGSNGALVGW